MNNKLVKIEAVRGAAALYVVLHHTIHEFWLFNLNLSFLFRFGSGFVIEYSYSKSKDKSFKTYFLKRFLRIYIPLFCVFFAHFLTLSLNQSVKIDWIVLLGNIFMLQDISSLKPNVIVPTFLGNSPLWSLSYEWWFYMLYFPIVTFFKNKSSMVVYIISILAAFTYIIYPNFFNRELMYFTIWWSGVEIAKLYNTQKEININNLSSVFISLVLITLILTFNAYINYNNSKIGTSPLLEVRHFGFSMTAIFVALVWKKLKWVGFSSILGVFAYFAPISYGIYITHYFLISSATYLDTIIDNNIIRYSIYFLICLGFSYLIEKTIYTQVAKLVFKKIPITTKIPFLCLFFFILFLSCHSEKTEKPITVIANNSLEKLETQKQILEDSSLKEGDIIFQTSTSSQSKAIQLATKSKYSHIGIILKSDKSKENDFVVLEAVQPVKYTPLQEWIERGENSHFVVKRLKNAETLLTDKAIKKMKNMGEKFLGKNYDLYFEWSDEKIYCSELVWKIYKETLNIEVGKLEKLSSFDLETKIVKDKMKERYGNKMSPNQLEEIVISPAAIFKSDKLVFVK